MNYVKLIAPAKINLILAIGEKLPDGYHEARTILHALSLHDTIEIRRTELPDSESGLTISVKCETAKDIDGLDIPTEDNIVYRAAMDFARAIGRTENEHLDISIAKQIPHQAGLGGGSSDAAAALKGLALLWSIDPSDPCLTEVAAKLGADVPFFLHGGCAYLDGRGDHFVHELEPRKGFLTLIRPLGEGISTKEAYQRFDEAPELPTLHQLERIATFQDAQDVTPWNNLTSAALSLEPELERIFALIDESQRAVASVLCGSGSAIAALCNDYESACALSVGAHRAGYYSRVTSFASLGADVLKQY